MRLRHLPPLMILSVVAACSGGAPPPANNVPPPPSAFARWDVDADQTVTLDEWERRGDEVFTQLDVDASGDLSEGEVEAGYDLFDINGDGVLTRDEVRSSAIDTDGDGVITREEWRGAQMVRAFDANRDGVVSRNEYRERRRRSFARYDRDGSGGLSRSELADGAFGAALFRF